MRKKNILVALILPLFISMTVANVPLSFGNPETVLAVSPTFVDGIALGLTSGSTFSIYVTVDDVPPEGYSGMFGYQFWLGYDTSVLTVTGYASYDPFTFFWDAGINDADGYMWMIYSFPFPEYFGLYTDVPFTVARVDFTVDAYGYSQLDLYNTKIVAVEAPTSIPHTAIDGSFRNIEIHDIAITDVTTNITWVEPGGSVSINVTVNNEGTFDEEFIDVTAFYDSSPIAPAQTVMLLPGETTTLTFTWLTSGVPSGIYTIKAEASPVPDETDISDNTFVDGTVTVSSGYTNVSGRISTNTTWTRANSPYLVVDDVVVETDIFLTIEPGVEVRFANGKNLIIDGALIAQGNSTHKITFTSNSATPKPGDWGTIRFRDSSIDNACIIDWVIIEYASNGITAYSSSPKIANSTLQFNVKGFESQSSGIPRIYNSKILNNTYGVYGSFGYYPPSEITHSLISNNTYGVYSSGSLTIQESTVSNNTYGIWSGTVKILGSNISYNTHGIGAASATISKSIISENNGKGISPLWYQQPGYPPWYEQGTFSISYSTITKNKENGIVSNGYGTNTVRFSNIFDNTPYDVYNLAPYDRNADVNATNNWWGTTETTEIDQHIYDYYDDYNLRRVIYQPFLDSPVTIPPVAHDVAITNVTASPASVEKWQSVYINAYVVNQGDFDENVTVIARYDSVQIGKWTYMYGLLPAGASTTAYFYWYPSNVIPGNYTISAEVSAVPGETDTEDNLYVDGKVTVKGPPPVHDIAITWVSASPTSVKQGEPVTIMVFANNQGDFTETFNVTTYYDSTVIAIKTVANLAPGASKNLTFTWNTSGVAGGNYAIKAVASAVPGETDTWDNSYTYYSVSVIGPQRPYAYFSYSPYSPWAGQNVTFDASMSYDPDGSIASYAWDFGDDNTGTGRTVSHVYIAGGNYTVTLTVTDNDGLTATSRQSVTVYAPTHDIAVSYMWVSPTYVYVGDTVRGEVGVYNQGTVSETFNVYVFADTNATVIGDEIVIAVFTDVNLSYGSSRYLSFEWRTTDVDPGSYTISAKVLPVAGEVDIADNILVGSTVTVALRPPMAYFNWQPQTPYVGDTVVFNASASYDQDGTIIGYNWDFGDDTTASTTEPIIEHTYSQAKTYTVNLTVTDNDELTSTAMSTITVIHRVLTVKVTGEFDYLRMEPVNIRLAALVKDANTMEPFSNALVTVEIYDPAGNLWISAQMQEKISGSGIYEWNSAGTIGQLKLTKGVYLVRAGASFRGGPTAYDISLFHIDPPAEGNSETLFYVAFAVIALASTTGLIVKRRQIFQRLRQLNRHS